MMKKQYQKPQFMIENFMLSENIASCSEQFGNNMDWLEAFNHFWGYIADGTGLTCNQTPPDGQDFDFNGQKLSYHTSSRNVFSS